MALRRPLLGLAGLAGLVAAPGLALIIASGCGTFGSADDGDGGVSEAAAAEASTSASEGSTNDGGSVLGDGCSRPTCEDFEGDAWANDWSLVGTSTASVGVTEGTSSSPSHAVDLVILPNDTGALAFVSSAGAVGKIVASANVLVLKRGDSDVDFFCIHDGPSLSDRGLHFVHSISSSSARFGVEEPPPAGGAPTTTEALTESFATYTRVTLELDVRNQTYAFTVGNVHKSGSLDSSWQLGTPFYVFVGAPYLGQIPKIPWHVRFDDIAITTSP